jgi:hypothetical protein
MKKHLLISMLCFLIAISDKLTAQITTPIINANFGTDADIKSNFFDGQNTGNSDDWFKNISGLGESIIDTTGAADIVRGYTTNPASRNYDFSRLMNQMPFSIVNNCVLLDAVFHRDFHGNDSTVFASGGNKNGMNPLDWNCPISQSIPGKNEILDVMAHVRRAGPTMSDSLWLFGGISIENTTGNRYFDFELTQTEMYFDMTLRQFVNVGADSGHTAWKFDANGNILSAGDIIFSAEFSSAALTNLEARIWVNRADLSTSPSAFLWGGAFDGASNSSTFGYASILPNSLGNFYTGLQSNTATWAGPFALIRQNNSLVTDYDAKQFMEFSVNMSKLGLDPAAYSVNICNSPFRRVLVKTRASTSFSSELKDFVAPIRMFNYPPVDAYTQAGYFCRTMPNNVVIQVANPNIHAIYTWTTSDGHIIGSDTGSSIIIDNPGTYFVSQQSNSICAATSIDSVRIIFDTACGLLPVTLQDFTALRIDRRVDLKWTVSNNQSVANYTVEYSIDNHNFNTANTVQARGGVIDATYTYSHPWLSNYNIIYYRLKITANSGNVTYSRIIPVTFTSSHSGANVFPNPTSGELWLSLPSSNQQTIHISFFDGQGRCVGKNNMNIREGENMIRINDISNKQKGIYFMKIKTNTEESVKSIILN